MIKIEESETHYVESWKTVYGMYYRVFRKYQGARIFEYDRCEERN